MEMLSQKRADGKKKPHGVRIRDSDGSSSQTTRLMGMMCNNMNIQPQEQVITIKGQFYCENVSDQIQFNKYGRGSITVLEIAQ